MGFRDAVSFLPAIQATRLLTFTLAGLAPAEHASLRWTHNPPCTFPCNGLSRERHSVSSILWIRPMVISPRPQREPRIHWALAVNFILSSVPLLPPFAMSLVFPTSDYYDGSDSWIRHRWTVHLLILTQVSHIRMDVLKCDNVGAGYQPTNPVLPGIPCGSVVIQVTRLILWVVYAVCTTSVVQVPAGCPTSGWAG
jgi:hypothetical protein